MNPVDTRHLGRMLDCISAVRNRGTTLVSAAGTLNFLQHALELREKAWDDEFTSHLVTLESAGIDPQGQIVPAGAKREGFATEALDRLEEMIRSRVIMPLVAVIGNLSALHDEETIYAARPWSPTTGAVVIQKSESGGLSVEIQRWGFEYFLEVFLVRDFLKELQSEQANASDIIAQCDLLIRYAETSA